MSVQILSNYDGAVFICSTSGWAFGPKMPDEETAEAFLRSFNGRDPRDYEDAEMSTKWAEFQARLICPYGHAKTMITNFSSGTVFSCLQGTCKVQWNLDGEEINEDEDEEDTLTPAQRLGER